ncbi:2-oxoglutarate dehydrogenase, E2 component, dihydrolipoamide succinyltransferase [Kocuria rhizophila]|uniref:Dihydrolipoamide acetyltransferase component of pyruvate dehydrogenase complex n=2 Tax=Kocuria rhizophila TaxID=72000 RepID=B2GJ84_KOCRD|nr:2-oxoglutarate dehydrogenase, E2 component, dihydrolipoamide succinyltransferase [Kocuria rhizophila]ASE10349.1 2-oxoglutarate dehydrogenase, E2 component, dihydrolipoamide succinyltransferase [Kocuria rhizophila]BAG29789.1 dihydrolipoamide acyltransferase [Kocuria rhizophila DC2201]
MSETVNLPALGESVTEGTVTRWLKQVGEEVAVDEPLVEVSTDKVDTEVPSPVAGVIEKILVDEDEDVEVGAPLVVIGDGSGDSGSDDSSQDAAAQEDSTDESQDEEQAAEIKTEQAPKADTKQASGNSVEVTLPALGESVTEGTVTRWLKQVGESIEVDEPLLEVSTDKVDTEVPSPVAGTILEIKVQEDEDAEVGQVLAIVGDESAASSDAGSDSDNGSSETSGETKAEKVEDAATAADSGENTEQAAEIKTEQAPKADTKQASGNSVEVTLPALGESVTEGTVTRWLKQVGESIEVDEPLLEVSTDKVDTEVPSPVAGTILEIKVQEDEDAEVGQVLAIVGDESAASSDAGSDSDNGSSETSGETKAEKVEDAATAADSGENTEQAAEIKTEQAPKADTKQASGKAGSEQSSTGNAGTDVPGYVTPLVRKLAREKNVDLSTLTGTGVGGRIRKQDVLAAAEKSETSSAPAIQDTGADMAPAVSQQGSAKAPEAAPAPDAKRGTTEKAPRIRMTIAKRMRESLDVSAQLTQVTEVDMTRVAKLRQQAKDQFQKREGAKLTFMPFFAKAVAEALQAHPVLNATFKEESKEIVYNSSEDIAIAVDTPRGLLVPVVKNAGDLNLGGLAKQIAELGASAKDGSISPDALAGGTFTITNIGSFGALFDTPIINQPQVGILGTGSIVKRPMVVTDAEGNDTIAIRHMCYLSLTYDHRLVDGADAGRFLSTLKKRLEAGQFESEVGL